jgi:hypothetical protein
MTLASCDMIRYGCDVGWILFEICFLAICGSSWWSWWELNQQSNPRFSTLEVCTLVVAEVLSQL